VNAHTREVSLRTSSVSELPILWLRPVLSALLAALVLTAVSPAATDGQYISNNTPVYVSTAKNLGPENTSNTIDVSIWLQPHNRSALDALASELYDPKSANYRHWLKSSEIAAQFAPTAAEAKTVEEFFESNNLKVLRVGPNNFYVRAQGTVTNVEKAFHVKLNEYQVGGKTLRANASNPYVEGPAAARVQAVSGLDSGAFENTLNTTSSILSSGSGSTSLSNRADFTHAISAADASSFDTVCFSGPGTLTYGAQGTYPFATYTGNGYASGSLGCGYSPANVYGAYNLNGLYAEGNNGAGQTVVIIDWCDSPTIRSDANAFSARFGLPELTSSNFTIINYPTASVCTGVNAEINTDVEWTHAIAPGANIDLLVPYSSDFEDVDEAEYYAATAGLGNVISGSYASPEFEFPTTELSKENLISEIAAVAGVATNFASGNDGPYGGFFNASVYVPADLPYATGVGGVSLALNADNSIAFQTGWETYRSILNDEGIVYDPPIGQEGFEGGSGGGPSAFFAKPSFQAHLPGSYRMVPDISWLGDPLTGGVIAISQPGQLPLQVWYTVGGTSLATPMFSALWAIANQEAGTALGQAAPYLYSMPSTTITDIVPYTSTHNPTAVIAESKTVVNRYNPAETLEVLEPLFGSFYSAIWDAPNGEELVVSFGQEYHSKVTAGWDDVTGLGTPNAKAFADWFAPSAAAKK
jgi:subtilase family serine protease